MANDEEEVCIVSRDCVQEPLFFEYAGYRVHDGVVCVVGKVKEKSKGGDAGMSIFGGEFAEAVPHGDEGAG